MRKFFFLLLLTVNPALSQYKMEPAAAAPTGVPAGFTGEMQPGVKILNAAGAVYCEVWLTKKAPAGAKSSEQGIALPTIPQGALLGLIHFPTKREDRRGQPINAGVYTLRYSLHPVNGDHLGVAPQRDFLVMVPIAEDKDPAALPNFDQLVEMSRKASGTPHPAVLSLSTGSGDTGFVKEGDHDWILNAKIGEQPVSIILVGKAEG